MFAQHDGGTETLECDFDERTCVDSARDALVALDRAGRVVVWSAGAERMYGWTAAEVMGRSLPWSTDGEAGTLQRQVHELAREGVVVGAVPVETPRRNGTHVVAEVSVDPVRSIDGRIIGTCSIHRDVTVRTLDVPSMARDLEIDLVRAEAEDVAAGTTFDAVCARYRLTPLERDLVALLLTGHRISGMARALGRSQGTIRNRLSLLYRKFGVRGQIELLDVLHDRLGPVVASGCAG